MHNDPESADPDQTEQSDKDLHCLLLHLHHLEVSNHGRLLEPFSLNFRVFLVKLVSGRPKTLG